VVTSVVTELSDKELLVQQWIETADAAARAVPDPELPFLTVGDLGILRGIECHDDTLCVKVSPTYTGCPAVAVIEQTIAEAVKNSLQMQKQATPNKGDLPKVVVERTFSPAWTTRDLTEEGRRKLLANGIAPPQSQSQGSQCDSHPKGAVNTGTVTFLDPASGTVTGINSADNTPVFFSTVEVACPRCESANTTRLSAFGSTPCKAQYRCDSCQEPFDYFKCLGHD